jgi:hypothetical protein
VEEDELAEGAGRHWRSEALLDELGKTAPGRRPGGELQPGVPKLGRATKPGAPPACSAP